MTDKNSDILETKNPSPKSRWRWKSLIKTLIIIGVVVGVAQYVFYYHAFPLLKEKICQNVRLKSQGLYTMDFDDVKINILGQRIILENFTLNADTSVYLYRIENEHYNKAIYNISVKKLLINHIGLKSFFSKNELYIKEIYMDSPKVRLVGKPDKSQNTKVKYDAVHTDLYPLLKPYFDALNIRKIKIKDGFFDFHMRIQDSKQQFGISQIDIELNKFYLNEQKFLARNQFYYSETIEIGSDNYVINLADSLHKITAERLVINTSDSTIKATNVKMESNPQKHTQRNRFDVSLKELTINGLDINRAYFDKVVILSNVSLKEPTIKFQKGGKVNKSTKKFEASNDGWFSLIKGTLRRLAIDNLEIDGASMSLYKPLVNSKPIYNVGNVNLKLEGFWLDSLSHRNTNKIIYSDNLTVVLNDYQMLLPDNKHQLTADNLMLSTSTQIVKAQKINIKPTRYSRDSTEKTMRISIPQVEISGIDMAKAYNQKDFSINKFQITLPDIRTTSFIDSASMKSGEHKHKAKLLEALSDEFFNSLKINNVSINRGKVNITSKASIEEDSLTLSGKMSVSIGNFVLNKATLSDDIVPFRTSSVRLSLEDAVIKPSKSLHTLKCKNFSIDTQHDRVYIEDFSFSSDNDTSVINSLRRLGKHSLLNLSIESTELTKAELLEAVYHGKINIEKLKIEKPHFYMNIYPQLRVVKEEVEMDSARMAEDSIARHIRDSVLAKFSPIDQLIARKIPSTLKFIKIDTLTTDSSILSFYVKDTLQNVITGTSSNFKLGVAGFYYCEDSVPDAGKFMFADDYRLDISNFKFMLPDKIHVMETGQTHLSTGDGELSTHTLSILPSRRAAHSGKPHLNIYCPEFSIKGADFASFDLSGILSMDSCQFNESIVLIDKHKDAANNPKENTGKKRNMAFKGLNIGNIQSMKSEFAIEDESTAQKTLQMKFDFLCNNLSIDSSNIAKTGHIMSFDDPYIDVSNFFVNIKDNQLRINNAHLENESMQIKGAHFGNPRDTIMTHIDVPEITLWQPDLKNLAFEKKLSATAMHIDSPTLNFLSSNKKKKQGKKFDITKLPINFEIDTVSASNVCIHLDRRFKYKPDLYFPNMDLLAINVNTEEPHPTIYPAEKITAGITNFKYPLRDSIYRFHFGRVELDPIHEVFVANQIDYRPMVGRYDFYKLFDYRRSATYVNAAKMTGYGFNLIDFIKTMKLKASRLEVDKFAFLSYDNKSGNIDSTIKPNLHQYIFTKLPIKVKVDTTIVTNSYMEIEQLSPEVGTPGVLSVNKLNGKIYNFTNDTADLVDNGALLVTGSGMLMNQSKVSAAIRYDLDSPDEAFICNFMADTVYLPILNPYLENGIFASVDDGTLTKARIYFKSNDYESRGQSQFFYHDLKLSLNKKDSLQAKRRGLLSFLANTVLRTKNTRKIGYIYAKPDSIKGFSSYWLSSVLSGAKSTVGFESKEQKGDRKFYHKILDAVTRRNNIKEYILDVPEGDLD